MEIVENIAGRAHRLAYSPAFQLIKTGPEDPMRIAKATLNRNWLWSSGLAILAFAILVLLDYRLEARTGVGTLDLISFAGAVQYRAAFFVWAARPDAAAAGFNLGFS